MEAFTNVISFINSNILWGIPLIIAIMGTGILISIRTRFLQVRKFSTTLKKTIIPTVRSIFVPQKKDDSTEGGQISQFQAFSAAISGTVGTGNIVGVAGAMLSGGPGAVFWMWVSAFFGLVTNYSENVLGLYFRKKDQEGNISGGPMYYISEGLGMKGLAYIFSLCCLVAALGMGMVQSNSLSGTIAAAIAQSQSQRFALSLLIGVVVA
ncbi:MAG: sodium:alanine symporter family protein, partial [Spirochaetales bacterium]|nr:sodium:alanine symporter family protein [Spirochaetales bacterium]